MITLIFGKPGSGKTALNCYFAVMNMLNRERYLSTLSSIELLNQDGFNFSYPPLEHSVFSNFTIYDECRYSSGKYSYVFNPFEFSLPTDSMAYSIFPPYSSLHIQEGQTVLNSRKSRNFKACVSGAYENHRHIDLDIYIDMQRPKLADSNVRELVNKFIKVIDMNFDYDDMCRIVSVYWNTLEFDEWADVERYINTGDINLGVKNMYRFDGDIFDCYNSKANKNKFYDKGVNLDFNYTTSDKVDCVSLVAPSNYYE